MAWKKFHLNLAQIPLTNVIITKLNSRFLIRKKMRSVFSIIHVYIYKKKISYKNVILIYSDIILKCEITQLKKKEKTRKQKSIPKRYIVTCTCTCNIVGTPKCILHSIFLFHSCKWLDFFFLLLFYIYIHFIYSIMFLYFFFIFEL
jgi:hypothetical protein